MPASTSTSERPLAAGLTLLLVGALACATPLHVARADAGPTGPGTTGSQSDKTALPEEEDFSTTPYTTYGEFNEEKEEEEDTRFFQYGRFFGVGIGLGVETADGNRGTLYQGGFPLFDFRLLYWFNFNFSLDLGFYFTKHQYDRPQGATPSNTVGHHDVNIFDVGVDLRYTFDTKDLSAPISFANPFVMVGVGSYNKTDTAAASNTPTSDSSIGLNFGGGLEFTLSPRRTFLDFEFNMRIVTFEDTYTADFVKPEGLNDLTGNFYTIVGRVLFTW